MERELVPMLLPAVLALPLVGGLATLLLGSRSFKAARGLALAFALAHVGLTAATLALAYPTLADPARRVGDGRTFEPQFVPGETLYTPGGTSWVLLETGGRGVQFFLGLDGLNFWLVALASAMLPPAILSLWPSVERDAHQLYFWMLFLQSAVVGFFLAFDIVLMYAFFELTLIPMFFLIGIWGVGSARREAARKFFLYTLTGSLFTLVGLIGAVVLVYENAGVMTFSLPELADRLQRIYADNAGAEYWRSMQALLFFTLAAGFAVKVPLVPLHSWLPDAYAEAPTGVTVYLSSLLAKMGTFGLLRAVLPLAPDVALTDGLTWLGAFAAAGIVYGAFCAYAQTDLKRMIAYSSVSHLGFCVLGLLAFNAAGVGGGVLHMVNHGVATGALFILAGCLYDRYGTHRIDAHSGLMNRLPMMSFFMFVVVLANIGVPGLNNFVSEMLMLGSLFRLGQEQGGGLPLAAAAAFGIFMGAWYLLTMMRRAFFGELREPVAAAKEIPAPDLRGRELCAVVPLVLLCLALGVLPQPVLRVIGPDAEAMAKVAEEARGRLERSGSLGD